MSDKIQVFSHEQLGEVRVLVFNERLCCIAKELGQVIGYGKEGAALVTVIGDDWKDEFIEGKDYDIVAGQKLVDLKALLGVNRESWVTYAPQIMVLYRSGIDMVCAKTTKPIGKQLRRWLVDEVLPEIRLTGRFDITKTTDNQIIHTQEDPHLLFEKEKFHSTMQLEHYKIESSTSIEIKKIDSSTQIEMDKIQLEKQKVQLEKEKLELAKNKEERLGYAATLRAQMQAYSHISIGLSKKNEEIAWIFALRDLTETAVGDDDWWDIVEFLDKVSPEGRKRHDVHEEPVEKPLSEKYYNQEEIAQLLTDRTGVRITSTRVGMMLEALGLKILVLSSKRKVPRLTPEGLKYGFHQRKVILTYELDGSCTKTETIQIRWYENVIDLLQSKMKNNKDSLH